MKEYAKVECSVSVLKEAKDRDFGTRYVISRSQIQILFSEATILGKSPWDSTAIFIIFCHFSVPSQNNTSFSKFSCGFPSPHPTKS